MFGLSTSMAAGIGPAPTAPRLLLLAASIVLAVLAVGVVGLVARLAMLLGVACGVVAAVLMYVPAANRWFAAQRP